MKRQIITVLLTFLMGVPSFSQKKNEDFSLKSASGYKFIPLVQLKATSVKDQASTSTCWCFATTSFIESELLRMGKGEYDLSEMWIVRYNYVEKLNDNFKKQGKGNLGEGSLAHDYLLEFSENGVVPDEVYTGLNYGLPEHNHKEMNSLLNAIARVPVDRRKESEQYLKIVNGILDTYLGELPSNFTYKGSEYTPVTFAKSLGINPDDYVEITSFTHFPFYTKGPVPVPDNWRKIDMYNVPLDDFIRIMDYSLTNGYTIGWDGDNSERGFSHNNGVAIIPDVTNARQEKVSEAFSFSQPFPEMVISQELRQKGFEDETTTDDHMMHITGIVKDQKGTKYYTTKNSWGPESNTYGGYLNMSETYVRAKTIFIIVHKNAIPVEIKSKLGL